MALPRFQATAVDNAGDIQSGATIDIADEATGLWPSGGVYSDRAGTVLISEGTLVADSNGFFSFYVAPGEYRVEATSAAGTLTWRYIILGGTASTADVTDDPTDTTSGRVWRTDDLVKTTGPNDSTAGSMLRNNDGLLRAKSTEYATYGGTADVITLTTYSTLSALVTSQAFRFKATAANTGATTINVDGIGALTAKTVTGAALPAGYIRTDIETECYYDGTDIIVKREVERGSNANGFFTKWADGTMTCRFEDSVTVTCSSAVGSVFRGVPAASPYTFPAAFISAPMVAPYSKAVTTQTWAGGSPLSGTQVAVSAFAAISGNQAYVGYIAEGYWY